MDYALSQTMTIGGAKKVPRLLLLYDIMCQWGVHMKQRFDINGLSMPNVKELLRGVGIWHVYAHVNRCFGRYAPIYLKNVGLVDGEILETLWSLLNQVSESCQTMSLANREETINFHMNDINRKKNLEMSKWHYHALYTIADIPPIMMFSVETLIRKWVKAQKLVRQRWQILQGLNESCTNNDQKQWTNEIEEILEKRIADPSIMDDFLSSVENGMGIIISASGGSKQRDAEPQRTEIELQLEKEDSTSAEVPGRTRWIIQGIKLQEEQ
jgi:Kyakuja-Dileera-Zisupton transposase